MFDGEFYSGDAFRGGDGQIGELQKALETSYLRQDQAGGQAMVPESLENTLISTTFKDRHLVLWKDIPKEKAYSTVEEYARLTEVGARGHEGTGFFTQGGKPEATDLTADRKFAPVKFLGTERGVTHPATLVNMIGGPEGLAKNDAEAKEIFGGTRWLLRQLERIIPFGDSDVIPTGITGIERQILGDDSSRYAHIVDGSANVIDMRGAYLRDNHLTQGAQVIEDNFGNSDAAKLYSSNTTLTNIQDYLMDSGKVRYQVTDIQGDGRTPIGAVPSGYRTNWGFIPFRGARFLDIAADAAPATGTQTKAPVAPTLDTESGTSGVSVAALGVGETSKFAAGDAGNFYYKVTCINHYGESAPLTVGPVAATAGTKVVIYLNELTNGKWSASNDENGVMGYRIYRSNAGGTAASAKYIDQVAAVDCVSDTFTDFNYFLPGTHRALMSDMSPEDSISIRVLLPLLKFPLAIIDTRIRFLLLLYLSHVILYSRMKHVEYINIGEYTPSS